ncbi:hypothetical protein MHU86_8353 [Fragilaria crotonensis]|nr:hypothetical protein MHU86_8353 [Fragilaria crotonensis]
MQDSDDESEEFTEALVYIGFNRVTAEAIVAQGFTSPLTLLTVSEDSLSEMTRQVARNNPRQGVNFPFVSVNLLKGFRHWTASQIRCGLEANSEDFSRAKAEEAVDRMQEEKKLLDGMDAMTPRKPEVLKNLSLWVKWWESWDNYIYHFRAEARCPLSYIHRAHTEVTNEVRDVEYDDLDEHLVNNTVLEGQHYAIDNKRYYAEFKSYISDGPGWTFIKHFDAKKDGRGAVLALKKQCEGESANMTIKAKAYAKLELELVGEAVPETKKVQDFLANIKDPTLQMGVTHCFGEPEKLKSFESCQQYLSTLATTTRAYKDAGSAARSVSSASTGAGSKSSGGKGTKRKGGKKQTNTKGYSNEEWWAMSDAERAAVVKARKEAGGKGKKKARRNAKLLSLGLIPGRNGDGNAPTPTPASANAGDQFGRRAHSGGSGNRGGGNANSD